MSDLPPYSAATESSPLAALLALLTPKQGAQAPQVQQQQPASMQPAPVHSQQNPLMSQLLQQYLLQPGASALGGLLGGNTGQALQAYGSGGLSALNNYGMANAADATATDFAAPTAGGMTANGIGGLLSALF